MCYHILRAGPKLRNWKGLKTDLATSPKKSMEKVFMRIRHGAQTELAPRNTENKIQVNTYI